jgi:AcrR family transcriptional regulator
MTSTDTKTQIVRAAEVLFAREGYAGTSLRQITELAGVNVAAVNYHFGSKEKLLVELLDRVIAPITTKRIRLLDKAESKGDPGVTELLTAFLLPDLEVIADLKSRDPALPNFVSRMYSEGSELMAEVMGRQFAEAQRRFYAAFQKALPSLSLDEIAWRLHCIVGIVVYLFATVEAPGMPQMLKGDREADLKRLLAVTVPLITAEEVVTVENT